MTNGELIKALSTFPSDLPVQASILQEDFVGDMTIDTVEKLEPVAGAALSGDGKSVLLIFELEPGPRLDQARDEDRDEDD